MAKYFITGGSGFVGSHIIPSFSGTKNEIFCLYHRHKPNLQKTNSVRWIQGDLLDSSSYQDALQHADYVIHLAGLLSARRAEDYLRINVEGTASLLAACQELGVPLKRFVHMSSIAVNGPNFAGNLLRESDRCVPQSEYGRSKQRAEQVVRHYAERFPVVILRPTFIYGRGDLRGLKFLLSLGNPTARFWASRIESLCLCHVSDVAQSCHLALREEIESGSIFIISDPEISSWEDVWEALEMVMFDLFQDDDLERFKLSAIFRDFAQRFLSTSRQGRPNQFWACDVSKALNILGFCPEMPFRKGALDTVLWYLSQGFLRHDDLRRILKKEEGP